MLIPAPPPGTNAANDAVEAELARAGAPVSPPMDLPAASRAAATAFGYAEFAAAVKDALRDAASPDLLARNPLLLHGVCNLGKSAGPQELKALLSETVSTLFANPRDEKAAPSAHADLSPTRPETGGGGRSAFAFVRDLPPPPWYRARSLGALAVGELAGCIAIRADVSRGADRKGREIRRRTANPAHDGR